MAALVDVGGREVDLVEDGDDGEVLLEGKIDVGHGLRFNSLRGIDDENGAFAGGETAGDFVGEVDVAGSVEEVELVGDSVFGGVGHGNGVGFDGDPFLALKVHGVEELGLGVTLGDGLSELQQTVGKSGLSVIDMRDDGEVASEAGIHEEFAWVGGRGAS